ncbi:MAG TPA: AMP-binding protein, partial [Burkholderiaceae bacterium]|nr:AMP-binding protein [Burkholderiaceae bacterium]
MSNLWNLQAIKPGAVDDLPGNTMPAMFWAAVARRGDAVWMREKKLGVWRSWSWKEAGQAVREVAHGLMALGFERGQTASIQANTVVEWVLADQAVMSCGGVSNGIYPTDAAPQTQYLCEDSRTTVLFVEDDEQLDKALEVRAQLPLLRRIVVFDMEGLSSLDDPMVLSLEALRALGREHAKAFPDALQQRIAAIAPEDLALLVYTSGTTGKPKGAMHLHGALTWTVRHAALVLPQVSGDERMCFLPLCHIAERMIGEFSSIYAGSILNFVENPDTVPENVREIAPTIFFAVPRVWEKFYSAVTIAVREATRPQQWTYAWAIGVGRQVAGRVLAQRPVSAWLKLRFLVARALVLNNVRRMIGIHRARYLLTGAAPIAPDLIQWYLALGVPMLEGWGMTETSGLGIVNPVDAMRIGTIGKAAQGVQARIDPASGEIQVRGRNVFAGYLNQPEKTAEAIDADGWLRTGDVGSVDADGYYRITDRMKDIIITAGGK